MKKVELKIVATEYSRSRSELEKSDIKLIEAAENIAPKSYAPYSEFHVGAAVLLSNGEIVTGSNQENAVYPSGLCAERVAIFYANSKYPEIAVEAIAITAYSNSQFIEIPVPPCGSCRQVLAETEQRFNKPIRVILSGKKKVLIIEDALSLLPFNFQKEFLNL